MRFFTGMHNVHHAAHVGPAFISVHRLRNRKKPFDVGEWIMDSGAFSTILKHGGYPEAPADYAAQINRWADNGRMLAATTQDYMCEAGMLARTGLTIEEHQRLTIERYDALRELVRADVHLMPVLQGYEAVDYVRHLEQYGERIGAGAWVGVGSVCKRNGNPAAVLRVLHAIKTARPDIRLHGFGLKTTALAAPAIRDALYSADSMAWSFAARKQGRDGNAWREAAQFAARINAMNAPQPPDLFTELAT